MNIVNIEICPTRKRNIISLFLWENRKEIGSYCNIPIELYEKYKEILIRECVINGNKNFRNSYDCILLNKAYLILEEKQEKPYKYRIKQTIKELQRIEIENWEEEK